MRPDEIVIQRLRAGDFACRQDARLGLDAFDGCNELAAASGGDVAPFPAEFDVGEVAAAGEMFKGCGLCADVEGFELGAVVGFCGRGGWGGGGGGGGGGEG